LGKTTFPKGQKIRESAEDWASDQLEKAAINRLGREGEVVFYQLTAEGKANQEAKGVT